MNANLPSAPNRAVNTTAPRPELGSLFSEMVDWMLVPFLVVWPLSVGITYLVGIDIANGAFDRSLGAKARALAEQVTWVGADKNIELRADLRTILSDVDAQSNSFRIDSSAGLFLLGEPELPTFAPSQLLEEDMVQYKTADFRDAEMRISAVAHRINTGGEIAILYVAENTTKRKALAYEIMKGIVLPQLFVVPLMILLMWLGLRRGVAPLKQLHARMVAREAHDLRPLEAGNSPEEVEPLINAFNELLQRVEQEGAAQKRFIANAAHQLRTPLAGIRTQAELAMRDIGEAGKTEALNKIAAGTARTAHLINQLLVLARTEGAAASALPLSLIDIVPLARDVVAGRYPAAAAKQIALSFDAATAPILIQGHPDLLRELISNLLDNAISYTPQSGNVAVRISNAEMISLEIEDDGIGIPLAEQEMVFERFYRVLGSADAAASSVASVGSGIGLAIVREIATRLDATVTVASPANLTTGRGSVFTVKFKAQFQAQ